MAIIKKLKIINTKIENPNDKSHYIIMESKDVEYVNPITYFASLNINTHILLGKETIAGHDLKISDVKIEEYLRKIALEEWEEKFRNYQSLDLPNNLIDLLNAKTKKEQIKSLKNLSLTSDELVSFFLFAYEKHGYSFSQYVSEHKPKGLDKSKLPKVIHIENEGEITTIGKTSLTKGHQKQIVEHRKIVTSKFIDKGDNWHCFFLTKKSLIGQESYKNGQPHLHYISDKWNIKREDIVKQLSSRDYRLPSLPHIDFHTYRNPK